MIQCKFCFSRNLIKAGFARNKQKYRCKNCKSYQIEGDDRVKYDHRIKEITFLMYLENMGFRNIGKILKVPYQTVIKWIKKRVNSLPKIEDKVKEIEILEIDELVTFVKKNHKKSGYGLLLTETETKLLILK